MDATKRNVISVKSVDGESLPFKERIFDLVTCRLALHHFPYPTQFFNESMRVLKNGRLLLVLDQLHPDNLEAANYIDRIEKLRDPSHNRAYNQTEWADMFQHVGLVIEQIEIVEKKHELIPWAERQGCNPDTIRKLTQLFKDAPTAATDYLKPQRLGTLEAVFFTQHIIISGKKPES